MSKLGISLNFNEATYWLKLNRFEGENFHCELVMKFGLYNIKVRYGRTRVLINLCLVEKDRLDLKILLKFEPKKYFFVKGVEAHQRETWA